MAKRILKANQINLSEEAQVINVPTINFFNPNANDISRQDDGFIPSEFGEYDSEDDNESDDFIDPEQLIQMAQQEAEEIKQNANNEADLIIQKAKLSIEAEKEKAREEGYSEGFEKGFEKGSEEARQAHEQLIKEAEATLYEAREERKAIIDSIEPDIINFIAELVEKLVGDALILNPQVILHIIRTGVNEVSGASELTVRVSKEDYEAAVAMKEDIMQMVDSDTTVTIVKDNSLNSGDCVIDTPIGSIESSLNKQLQSLKNDLFIILRE